MGRSPLRRFWHGLDLPVAAGGPPFVFLLERHGPDQAGDELFIRASVEDIAARENVAPQRIGQMLRLALLDPGVVEDAIAGRQPDRLTVDRIVKSPHHDLWPDQRVWAAQL